MILRGQPGRAAGGTRQGCLPGRRNQTNPLVLFSNPYKLRNAGCGGDRPVPEPLSFESGRGIFFCKLAPAQRAALEQSLLRITAVERSLRQCSLNWNRLFGRRSVNVACDGDCARPLLGALGRMTASGFGRYGHSRPVADFKLGSLKSGAAGRLRAASNWYLLSQNRDCMAT